MGFIEHPWERAGVITPGLPILPHGVERHPVPGGGSRAVPISKGDEISILDKEGSLTPEEWERVRAHSAMGADIIQNISGLCEVAPLARWHHERLDGTDYPDGLTDLQLPLEVCILTVADVFDALIASRPYRSALSVHDAIRVLKDGIGKAFDKDCVAAIESTFALFEQGTGYDLSATA